MHSYRRKFVSIGHGRAEALSDCIEFITAITACTVVRGYDHTCKSMWRCDNVGGLGEHVNKHILWFIRYTFFLLYSSAHAERAHVVRF